ncbi:MAG: hydroxyacid dehydrogenase [Desulfobacteraceae bacterium]|nr:MAG: hydroxyacid dehydrogenase [Desulfobacteraceae bacterium]
MNRRKPKALYYDILKYHESSLALLKEHFDVVTLPDPSFDRPDLLSGVEALIAPLGFDCGREKIDACPDLKVIGSNTTGEPHIDRVYAESKGIRVVSLMNDHEFLSSITPTAEHTWGLLLAVTRRVPWAFASVLGGTWSRWEFGGSQMLSRMALGIVGMGRLGRMVARYGVAFGMKVRFFDPYVRECGMAGVENTHSLQSLVEASDVVTIHVPLNRETTSLIDRDLLSRFKHGAYLINTSRAEIVDEDGLLRALEGGKLSGAGVDVIGGEFSMGFRPGGHPLVEYARNHQNLVITPHIGGSTRDAWSMTQVRTVEKMCACF